MEENKVPQETKTTSTSTNKPPVKKPSNSDFNEKIWQPLLRPIVALTVITLITSLLLALTNSVTEPIIKENSAKAADAARRLLLPEASGFEEVTIDPLPDGVASMFKSTNDTGYIIEAYGRGYGGKVPVMVAFTKDGKIAGITFLENNETPGLGKKLNTDSTFGEQFIGHSNERINNNEVQAIANATISSNAATAGINAAIELFNTEVMGNMASNLTPEEVRAFLLPDATEFALLPISADGVSEAYKADDGNYIVYAAADGFKGNPVTVAVALSPDGVVLNLWADTSTQTEGWGSVVGSDNAFISQFVGLQNGQITVGDNTTTDSFDVVADATLSSRAVGDAVVKALSALEIVKEAA